MKNVDEHEENGQEKEEIQKGKENNHRKRLRTFFTSYLTLNDCILHLYSMQTQTNDFNKTNHVTRSARFGNQKRPNSK